jgi:hypothetical protein
MTFGQPCISPYLPVYIGVNKLPEDITSDANPVAKLFEDLRLAIEYHQEYAKKIQQYWTVFEIQTVEESFKVETAASALADKGDIAGARVLLTDFVNKKWAEATAMGKQWVDIFKALPLSS